MNIANLRKVQMKGRMVMDNKKMFGITGFGGRVVFACLLMCVFASAGFAQQAAVIAPQFEVAGAFSYVHGNAADSGGGFNLAGGSASFAYNYQGRFAIVADVGAYRFTGLGGGLTSTMYTYMAGPRLPLRRNHRTKPFVQALAGGGRLNASSSGIDAGENSFAMALGGGIDLTIKHQLAVRLIEADYLLTRFAHPDGTSATQNNMRISAGIVFRFGTRE
jgi:Outer membrane protein beta-barrel domain